MSPSGAQNILFVFPCESLGPKIHFSRFRVEVLNQKSFFRVSVWKFKTKNAFSMLPCESFGPKILFSCFRVEVLDQKSFFHASVWKFRT